MADHVSIRVLHGEGKGEKRDWKERYAEKLVTARAALHDVRNGQTIFVGSGAAEPVVLTETLAEMAEMFSDIQIIQLMAQRDQRLARPELSKSFRYNTFFIGRGVESAVASGEADVIPINLSDLPMVLTDRLIPVDVVLIQIAPPGPSGYCSLGISVDAAQAAVESAALVIAQVNENMPVTSGDSKVHMDFIDYLVPSDTPLIEVPPTNLDPISLTIGRHIANIIPNGATLHMDMGTISAATMRYLDSKKDLGIHTDILTDDIMRLIRKGVVTNSWKSIKRGKTVASMCVGSSATYHELDHNLAIELHPIDYVNNPAIISKHDNMVALFTVQEVELSGLAKVGMDSAESMSVLPSSTDFIDGTHRARRGQVIVALPSTSPDGTRSNIVVESTGRGVYFNRAKIDLVATEYGSVHLYGKSLRERAIALISIAHPRFRHRLMQEAKRFHYVEEDQKLPSRAGCIYPQHYEFTHKFPNGLEVFFRPVKPSDMNMLRRMFYSLSEETRRTRFHATIKVLTKEEAQNWANVDYSRDMAIVGLVGTRGRQKIIAEGRYMHNPANDMGEFDIVVSEDYRGTGIGTFLANYLKKVAYSRGLSGVYAEVFQDNVSTMALMNRVWPTAVKRFESGICIFTLRFPEEDVKRPKDSILVYSGRFNDFSYGENHPFRPERAQATLECIEREGFLGEPWMRVVEPNMVHKDKLVESHDPEFIEALERANSGIWDESMLRFNLGKDDTPVFPGLFDYIMLYTSATLTGAELITKSSANVVFSLLGGFHHASRSHAEGFCYLNDVIMAVDWFLARGHRVATVDLDAHHGNGIQDAYYRDDRVLKVSLHETGKTLYPWSGFETETGEGMGKGFNINVPLPPGTDDETYIFAMDSIVTPAVKAFNPSVLVAIVGADTHKNDPLTNLNLTNNGMVEAVIRVRDYCKHSLMLPGGGYDINSTKKAWCRVWATANRIDSMPDYLLMMGGTFLGSEDLLGGEIVDRAWVVTGAEKKGQLEHIDRLRQFHEEKTIPLIRERRESDGARAE